MRVLCPPHAQTFKVFWMHNWTVNLFSLFNMSGMDSEIESLITFYSSVLVSGARNFATGVKNRRQKPTPVFWRRFQAPVSGARVFGITLSSLAQSLHNHPSSSSISALPYLCSTSSQHLLFISRHSRAAINIILVTDNWSFFSIYFVSGINSLLFYVNLIPVFLSAFSFSYHISIIALSTFISDSLLTKRSQSLVGQSSPYCVDM